MWKWLAIRREQSTTPERDGSRLERERELQGLRLELHERDRTVANLKEQLARERECVAEALHAQLERLFAAAATPVTQLHTQAHRLEVNGRPVGAKDVLANARRLVRVLEDEGLALEETVDETSAFDPNRHEPLRAGVSIELDEPVIVQFAAITYRGKCLRKAGVVARGE